MSDLVHSEFQEFQVTSKMVRVLGFGIWNVEFGINYWIIILTKAM
jgi:hypothetical protein